MDILWRLMVVAVQCCGRLLGEGFRLLFLLPVWLLPMLIQGFYRYASWNEDEPKLPVHPEGYQIQDGSHSQVISEQQQSFPIHMHAHVGGSLAPEMATLAVLAMTRARLGLLTG